eukprot:4892193-Pyramimonas_sp.AAC.1
MRAVALGPSVEHPMRPRSVVLVGGVTHGGGSAGIFGGVLYGATKRCTGWRGRVRAVALGPSVEDACG